MGREIVDQCIERMLNNPDRYVLTLAKILEDYLKDWKEEDLKETILNN